MAVIVLFFASLLLIYSSKHLSANIMAPASFLSIFWSVFVFISLIGTITVYEWDYYGIFWIYISLLLLNVSYSAAAPFHLVISRKNDSNKTDLLNISSFSWKILSVLILLGLLKWAFQVYANGFSFSDFLSLENLADMNHEFAVNRYSGAGNEGGAAGSIIAVLNAMVYAAPLCGGFSYAYSKTRRQSQLSIVSLLPAFLVTMTNNTKAGMIGSILLFLSSYIIGYYSRHKRWIRFKIKTVLVCTMAFMGFLSMMLFSMMLRIGSVDFSTFYVVLQKIIIYAFGNVQSFDIWLSRYYGIGDLTFGTMTFLGVADVLGLAERVQGVYTALLGTSSNVYTVFRGIVSDFGVLGGTIFVMVQGFFLRIAANSIHDSSNPFCSVSIASSILFFFMFGMFVSPWTYLSFILAFFIFMMYVLVAYYHANC